MILAPITPGIQSYHERPLARMKALCSLIITLLITRCHFLIRNIAGGSVWTLPEATVPSLLFNSCFISPPNCPHHYCSRSPPPIPSPFPSSRPRLRLRPPTPKTNPSREASQTSFGRGWGQGQPAAGGIRCLVWFPDLGRNFKGCRRGMHRGQDEFNRCWNVFIWFKLSRRKHCNCTSVLHVQGPLRSSCCKVTTKPMHDINIQINKWIYKCTHIPISICVYVWIYA